MNWENYQDWLERASLSTTQSAEAILRNIEFAEGPARELAICADGTERLSSSDGEQIHFNQPAGSEPLAPEEQTEQSDHP